MSVVMMILVIFPFPFFLLLNTQYLSITHVITCCYTIFVAAAVAVHEQPQNNRHDDPYHCEHYCIFQVWSSLLINRNTLMFWISLCRVIHGMATTFTNQSQTRSWKRVVLSLLVKRLQSILLLSITTLVDSHCLVIWRATWKGLWAYWSVVLMKVC